VLKGFRDIFTAAYTQQEDMAELYSSSNTEVAPLTVESLERTAQEIKREVEARRQVNVPPLIFRGEGQKSVIWGKYKELMLGGPKRLMDTNAYYDGVKAAARQARIARNEQDGVALGGRYIRATPENLRRWRRESQELVLARAIERTQLPHETTIHERIMPYRVKE
jgi:LmbE family N-acetylglucosaminyl deacetylase